MKNNPKNIFGYKPYVCYSPMESFFVNRYHWEWTPFPNAKRTYYLFDKENLAHFMLVTFGSRKQILTIKGVTKEEILDLWEKDHEKLCALANIETKYYIETEVKEPLRDVDVLLNLAHFHSQPAVTKHHGKK